MRFLVVAFVIAAPFVLAAESEQETTFTTESEILAVSREDQTDALKTKLLRKVVTLSDAISVMTTFKKVSKLQYLIYDHQIGARGTITLTGGRHFSWEIEPGYAARIRGDDGAVVYLLHPDAKTEPSAPANEASPRR